MLGWQDAPDQSPPTYRLPELPVGTAPLPNTRSIRRSMEFLESQPWLPMSVRTLVEDVLQAIGRPPVRPLLARLPEPQHETWAELCAWANPQRRDLPGRLRMARRAFELLTGSWPWRSRWVDSTRQPSAWVDKLLHRERRVMLDYAPITKCSCEACGRRRVEIADARRRFDAEPA